MGEAIFTCFKCNSSFWVNCASYSEKFVLPLLHGTMFCFQFWIEENYIFGVMFWWTRIKRMRIECGCFCLQGLWQCKGCSWLCSREFLRNEQALGSITTSGSLSFFHSNLILSYEMHSTTVLACHSLRGKNKSWEHDFWPCRCYGACESCLIFGDPELRTSIGLSGLQGPGRVKEKKDKERNELRDLVIQKYDYLLIKLCATYLFVQIGYSFSFSQIIR
jgi:hypothetical protein